MTTFVCVPSEGALGLVSGTEWLRARSDFQRVFEEGRSFANPLAAVYFRPTVGPSRVGVAVARRAGTAVARNRLRRRFREIVRLNGSRFAPGWQVVIVARPQAAGVGYREVERGVLSLLERAGLAV